MFDRRIPPKNSVHVALQSLTNSLLSALAASYSGVPRLLLPFRSRRFIGGRRFRQPVIGNHEAYKANADVSEEDEAWVRETYGDDHWYREQRKALRHFYPLLRRAVACGDWTAHETITLGGRSIEISDPGTTRRPGMPPGVASGTIGPQRVEELDAGAGTGDEGSVRL